jgi:superfamily II DNA or RNA helicase
MWRPRPEDLHASFADTDLRRGERYADEGRVLWVDRRDEPRETLVTGEVRGSRRRPYRVHVRAYPRGERWRLDTHCSCPVQIACKHAAALVLEAFGRLPKNERLLARAAAGSQPEHGRIGFIAGALHAQRVLGLRLGRWIAAAQGAGWRFEDMPPVAARAEMLERLGEAASLVAAMSAGQSTFADEAQWWLPRQPAPAALLEAARRGLLAWERPGLLLSPGSARPARWHWEIDLRGVQRLYFDAGTTTTCVRAGETWLYVDPVARDLGLIEDTLPAGTSAWLANLPPLPASAVAAFEAEHGARLPADFPHPQLLEVSAPIHERPQAILTLHRSAAAEDRGGRRSARLIGYARLSFRYGPVRIGEGDPAAEITLREGDAVQRFARDRSRERELATRLKQLGLISNRHAQVDHPGLQQHDWLINPDGDEQSLNEFCYGMLPRLRAEGWRLEYGPRFPLKLVDTDYRFYGEVEEGSGGLFTLELGIDLDGEHVNLLPVLREGLREGRFADLPLAEDAIVALTLPGDRRLPISAGRLRTILAVLNELGEPGSADQRRLTLPRARAAALAELEAALGAGAPIWQGAPAVRALAATLSRYSGLPPTPVPAGFRAELRPYQVEGLAWLRFLAGEGLSGILADDMGLGKTVQVLAFLQGEKEAGRLADPALVVCPKSVLPNWLAECRRFTPDLAVLVHAGPERERRVRAIGAADIVLTTYPVLARDVDKLGGRRWRVVVLDESQMVKNPATLAARAARRLDTELRVCLTGTPLENHLGELWAQFDFLMPGLLGSRHEFQRHFRVPIEKARRHEVAEQLRRRIRPFLLRRTKDQVVAELPRKTEITRVVQLEGRQRDLYDAMRAAYAEQLRGYVESGALERHRMQVLEGLMRLRQVCCDPRLVGFEGKPAAPSAKLAHLVEMIRELSAAGRRMLVFSQFTSMLELIESELGAARIRYVKLTGQTEDRATPVQRFQRGEVPVFLISLRAGGFGLNLTRADTVIHYDPWWNPAVESQATDRAHRIGQDKPVFVYRLIAADTVEERITQLQAQKRELADALYDESGQSLAAALGPQDWLALVE